MTDPRLLLDNLMSIDISSIREMQTQGNLFFEGAQIRKNVPNRSMKNIIDEYMKAHPKATMPKAPPSTRYEMPPAAEVPSRVAVKFNSDPRFRLRVYLEFAQRMNTRANIDRLNELDPKNKADIKAIFNSLTVEYTLLLDAIDAAMVIYEGLYGYSAYREDQYYAQIRQEQLSRWGRETV